VRTRFARFPLGLARATRWILCLGAVVLSLPAQALLTPSTGLSGLPAHTSSGQLVSLVATVSGSGPIPTGVATFSQRDTSTSALVTLCSTVVLDGSGLASCAFNAPVSGTYQIEVDYFGDSSYVGTSTPFPFLSGTFTPSMALTGLQSIVTPSSAQNVTIDVNGILGPGTGPVDFVLYDSSSPISTLCSGVTLDGIGEASCSFAAPATAGSWQVVVNFPGDSDYDARSLFTPFATQYSPSISVPGFPSSIVTGTSLTVTANFDNGTASPPTGSANFVVSNPSLEYTATICSFVGIDSSGNASCPNFTAGTPHPNYILSVAYVGDPANAAVTQSFPFVVTTAPIVVTNTNDSGAGSLRQAILDANSACATVNFAIPGTGPFTISPLTMLPTLTCGMIDGFSQSGAAQCTAGPGSDNATIMIALNGSSCPGCDGLAISGGTSVQGLSIHSFGGAGLAMIGSGTATAHQNYVGIDPTGAAAGNGTGIVVAGSAYGQLDYNVITGQLGHGVIIFSAANLTNNLIGGTRSGSSGMGNLDGVVFSSANYSPSNLSGNFIRYNSNKGVVIDSGTSQRVVIGLNSIFGNASGWGVDLNDDGPTPNDEASAPYDSDSGPNGLQNYPVITSVVPSGSDTVISGYLKSNPAPSPSYITIALYSNSVFSSNIEGETPLGLVSASSMTDMGSGYVTFAHTLTGQLVNNVSAMTVSVNTCSDCPGASSEFSPMVAATAPPDARIVTNTNDSGTGSLRNAITYVNANCTAPNITFNIAAGGVQVIQPLSALPTITCNGTVIDGFSQPGASANTLGTGDNATRLIEIKGGLAGSVYGLQINAASVVIRGLIIDNFQAQGGIAILAPLGTAPSAILGNLLGDPTGTRLVKNSAGVRVTTGATGVTIGSASPADRNIIVGNDLGIWMSSGDSSTIQNNYIGTNGSGAVANDTGISASGTTNLQVFGNVISGNLGDGIALQGSTSGTIVRRNFIGTDASGTAPLGNPFEGILLRAGASAQIGGTAPGDGNVIAFNGAGVNVQGTGIPILGNSIFQNVGRGINLNGVAPSIDHCDADVGANNLQNYPVITSATLFAGTLTITGTLDSADLVTYRLELFSNFSSDAASNAAGRVYIGTTPTVTSFPPTCSTPWSVALPYAGAVGDLITATATDSGNNTSWFSVATAVTPAAAPTVPGAPTIGTATAGNAQATVTFTPPASNGGSAITGYTATSSPGGFTATGAGSPLTVTGLTNGTAYTFTVTATNAVGTGAPSAASNSVTPAAATVPGAPTIGTATAGNAQATITFTPPASNGGSPITSYTATSNPGGFTAAGAGSPLTVTGLTNGTSYTFKVTATNAVGTGPLSAATNSVTPSAAPPTPAITLTPPSLSFAARTVQTTSPAQTVTVTNNGPGTLTIGSILAGGDFAFATACPASLPALATCTINVAFTPLIAGLRSGTLTLVSNAAGSPHVVSLSGTGQAIPTADILVTPGVNEFGAQGIGTDSPVQIITVNSSGTAPLTLGTIDTTLADFVLKPGSVGAGRACGATLAAGDSCDVAVAFHPTAEGIRDGQLRVANNASGLATVRIVGRGIVVIPPRPLTLPGQLTFGPTPVGVASAGQALPITNNTASPVAVTGLTASGDFSVSDACATIAAHATCTPLVLFRPTAVGARSGSITVHALADSVPYIVGLTGTGTVNPIPALGLSVTQLGFGNVLAGAPRVMDVTLTNIGQVPLVLNSISVSGSFSESHVCPPTLAVGQACVVSVTLLPFVPGGLAGALTVVSNAAGSPHRVDLSGMVCSIPSVSRNRVQTLLCGP
jgi:parallel beta-helix repeat protein